MEASRAATGMLEVLATRHVLLMIDSVLPSTSTVSSGKSRSTLKIQKFVKLQNLLETHGHLTIFSHVLSTQRKIILSSTNLSHFISTFTATHINDDVRVGVFG